MLWTKVSSALEGLTLLLSCWCYFRPMHSKAKTFRKSSKTCHVGIHRLALTEYVQMSTHLPWFQSFLSLLSSFHVDQISHQQHSWINQPCFDWVICKPVGLYNKIIYPCRGQLRHGINMKIFLPPLSRICNWFAAMVFIPINHRWL